MVRILMMMVLAIVLLLGIELREVGAGEPARVTQSR